METAEMVRGNEESLLLQKIDEISRKQDRIPDLISEVERRQRADLEVLRRDFERLFVSHSEYDPKHQVLLDKVKEYDQIIVAGRVRQEEFALLKNRVNELDEDIEHIKTRSAGLPARVLPWLAFALSAAAVLLNYAQHVVIR